MQLNGEKIRFFGFCVCFWPPLASFNLFRAIYDIFCEMPTLFFYNLYDGESQLESRDGGREIRCCSFAYIAQFMQEPNLLGKPN